MNDHDLAEIQAELAAVERELGLPPDPLVDYLRGKKGGGIPAAKRAERQLAVRRAAGLGTGLYQDPSSGLVYRVVRTPLGVLTAKRWWQPPGAWKLQPGAVLAIEPGWRLPEDIDPREWMG